MGNTEGIHRGSVPRIQVLLEPAWWHHAGPDVLGECVRRLLLEARVVELYLTCSHLEVVVWGGRQIDDPAGLVQETVESNVSRIIEEVHDNHVKRHTRPLPDSGELNPVRG